ncbi:hypothetical protein ACFLU6_08285 [Acidobacteriota bacterium]
MKRQFPLIFCLVFGLFAIIAWFFPVLDWLNREFILNWTLVIFGFSMILGILSLLRNHIGKIRRMKPGWGYNLTALTGYFLMVFVGFIGGKEIGTFFMYLYFTLQVPVQATMFSILAFYIASAAFRAFRARNLDACLLLGAAIIVMLGQVPLCAENLPGIAALKDWILNVPNMASKRGILIGVGLGMISTALKIIVGIERTYLGRGES